MLEATVEYGQFRVTLDAYTPGAQEHLEDLLEHLPLGIVSTDTAGADWRLSLITPDSTRASAFRHRIIGLPDLRLLLSQAWEVLKAAGLVGSLLSLGTGVSDHESNHFAYLIPEKRAKEETCLFLANYLFKLKKRWLTQKGWIPLHAAVVLRRSRGFLFLGRAGAGKSTVVRLSLGIADAVLHDDQVLVMPQESGNKLMAAPCLATRPWTWSERCKSAEQPCENWIAPDLDSEYKALLGAIFVLKKDAADFLVPLSPLHTAYALVTGFLEACDPTQPKEYVIHAVSELCHLARQVPSFELHFRKSPDFWKLIDEQFPG